jgi:hypothetical protein
MHADSQATLPGCFAFRASSFSLRRAQPPHHEPTVTACWKYRLWFARGILCNTLARKIHAKVMIKEKLFAMVINYSKCMLIVPISTHPRVIPYEFSL